MLLREAFSNSISYTVINEYDNGAVVIISAAVVMILTMFVRVYHIVCGRVL